MTDVNQKSTITDIAGKSWADLCDSSQSSQSQVDSDSPSKNNKVHVKEEDDLYDLVFQPIKQEPVNDVSQDDRSLTSFMNNVHMVTPIKQENDISSNLIINEDTVCSPFIKEEPNSFVDEKPVELPQVKSEFKILKSITPNIKQDVLHAKRRLTSECDSTVTNPVTPERVNKVNKKSTDHRNIHDAVESPKYVYLIMK